MKKGLLVLSLLCLIIIFAACSDQGLTESSVPTETTTNSTTATSIPTPNPIPTYAPGTELYGMLSVTGEVVIEPRYEYLGLFSDEGLANFEDHGLWGYVNPKGVETIPAQFEDAKTFSEGFAAVKVNGLWGFIDVTGEMVIEPQFEEIQDGFIGGRCVFYKGDKCGFIDDAGTVIGEPLFVKIQQTTTEYYIVTGSNEKYGVIDRDGNTVLEFQDSYIEYVASEGYIFFPAFWKTEKNRERTEAVPFEKVIDENGKAVYAMQEDRSIDYSEIPYYYSEQAWAFYSDLLIGHYVIAKDFEDDYFGVFDMSNGEYVTERIYNGFDRIVCFNGSYYAITAKMVEFGEFGVVSLSTGETILGNEYYGIHASPHAQFAAQIENRSSRVYDSEGNALYTNDKRCLINDYLLKYDCWEYECEDFDGTINYWGLINVDGETVFKSEVEHQWFRDGSPYLVHDDGSITFIDTNFQLQESGPFESFVDQTRKSGIIIAYDASGKTEVINVRGEVLFSSGSPLTYVDGNEEYFVFSQKLQ